MSINSIPAAILIPVVNLLDKYTVSQSASLIQKIQYIAYRIFNGIKSLASVSDWQWTESILAVCVVAHCPSLQNGVDQALDRGLRLCLDNYKAARQSMTQSDFYNYKNNLSNFLCVFNYLNF